MPYRWTTSTGTQAELKLWPHNALPLRGFAGFMLALSTLAAVPLLALLGTALLWGILPFVVLAMTGIWWALRRNRRDRQVIEVLTLTPAQAHLARHNPGGTVQEWQCNRYWARPELHANSGPVPYYITLKGGDREVEIGAFLSEDERKALYDDLVARLSRRA